MTTSLLTPSPVNTRATPAIVWAGFLAYLVWVVAMLAGLVPRGAVNDILFLPLYLGTAWLSFRAAAARSDHPKLARGWRLVGMAWLCSAIATVVWVAARFWPSPLLDWSGWVLYNSYYPLTVVGLWHFFQTPKRGTSRIRLAAECLIIAAATLVLAWYFVFRFDEATREPWSFLKTVSVLVPGEVFVIAGACAVLHRPARSTDGRSLTYFGIGTFAAGVADFVYQQDLLVGSTWSGPTGDLLLAFGATLVMVGAWMSLARRSSAPERLPGVAVGLTLLPYLAVGVVAVLLVFESTKADLGDRPIAGLTVGGGVLLALVIFRLLVAHREYVWEANARAAQDARFRSLVQWSSDGILVVDPNGRISYASPASCRLVGLPENELDGRLLIEFAPPDQRERMTAWLSTSINRPLGEWRIGQPGAWRDVEALATDLTDDPTVAGTVVNLRDVTERLRLEADLVQAQKLEVVGRLSSSIAHDFNNLLTVIIGNLELVRPSSPGDDADAFHSVEAAAHRGAALSRQLLSLSRPTERSTKIVDLGTLVRSLEPILRTVLPSSIRLVVTVKTAVTPVALDDAQAEQILLNLALNARDAMPAGGTLDVSVGVEPGRDSVRLSVADTGIGMSTDTLAHAFEPFFTTKAGLGTGLGLSTVRRIANNAGGEVQIASSQGAGTTVSLLLPLVTEGPVNQAVRGPAPTRGSGHILVVDDEPAVRRVLTRQLTQVGYRVSEAIDGETALDRLRTAGTPVDLVLTDLVMPNMGGEALARHLSQEHPRLPVLCMSGTPGLATGGPEPWSAGQVIAKPVDFAAVSERIAGALTVQPPDDS